MMDTGGLRRGRAWVALLALGLAPAASAQMLDVDGLLVEASAVPEPGTVRVFANGGGQSAVAEGQATANVAGSLLWVPVRGLAGDVGAYYQTGSSGPSVRLRYQLLHQDSAGVNLSLGARYKSVGFSGEGSGEVEAMMAIGRSWGRLDTVLNVVWGWEVNDPGMDAEIKALVGWRFTDGFRAGLEARIQSEVHDEDGWKGPRMLQSDIRAGPTAFWRIAKPVTAQLLLGVGKPVGVNGAGFLALGAFSFDI